MLGIDFHFARSQKTSSLLNDKQEFTRARALDSAQRPASANSRGTGAHRVVGGIRIVANSDFDIAGKKAGRNPDMVNIAFPVPEANSDPFLPEKTGAKARPRGPVHNKLLEASVVVVIIIEFVQLNRSPQRNILQLCKKSKVNMQAYAR